MKVTLLFTSLLLFLNVNSQCIFPTGAVQSGVTQTFCVNSFPQSQNVTNVKGNNYILINVVKGFTYSFSVGDVFSTDLENLNIFDTSNVNIGSASGATGASISNWIASFSGQIKITLSYGACNSSSTTGKTIVLSLISVGNSLDNQNSFGTDTWIGHVYNWTGSAPPGGTSPISPAATFPFNTENYVGYYSVPSESISELFGGDSNCFPLLSSGLPSTSIYTETYAVRYKMKSKRPAGCYIATFKGDDGIRLYVDNQLVFNQWIEQSPTNYYNVLIYLNGNSELLFDYYENGGQNNAEFSLTSFDSTSNTISLIGNSSVCNNVTSGLLDGSPYVYNGGAINPTIAFQWQVSTNNSTFSDIVGATTENYSPPATTTSGTLYYRRVVSASSNATGCRFSSNSIAITTSTTTSTITPVAVAGTNASCSQFYANWNAVAGASSYALDVSTVSNFLTVLPGYNALNVGNVTNYLVTGLTANVAYYYRIRPILACGVGKLSNTITYGTLNVNKPSDPTITAASCTSFTANWTTQTNATSYELDVSAVNTFATFLPGYNALNVGNVTSFSVTGLPQISPLYFRIRAASTCGVSLSSNTVTIVIGTKWDGSTWSSGVPDLTKFVIIDGNYDMSILPSFDACSVQVNSPFVLKVDSNKYVNIQNGLTVNSGANIIVENDGSIVQISNTAINTGVISVKRDTKLKLQDYSYWSAPVGNATSGTFPVQSISPLTPSNYIFKWGTTTANLNGGEGTWINTTENMIPAKGYIIRAPNGFTNSATSALNTNFIGVPNNGIYSPTIFRGNDYSGIGVQGILKTATDDNWNLIGNPYPSAIGVNEFLTLPANSGIEGFVKIWTHGQLPTNITSPFYQSYTSNYYPNDYISVNLTAATSGPGNYKIGTGQGFMVLMNPGLMGSGTVTFNNGMRSTAFANNQFYRNSDLIQSTTATQEQHRIWLDLVTPTGSVNRTVVGYVTGATQEEDRLYDAFTDNKPSQNFYSLIEDKPMVIQGRALPFNVNDLVSMGIQIPTDGTYTIAIATVDGLFSGKAQKIYIEDKLLNTINDITDSPYQFTATQGITNDRFVLRYTNQTLSNTDFNLNENTVTVFASNNGIQINSSLESIKNYTVYNVLGQILTEKNNLNTNESVVSSILKNNQALIVKVTLTNGQTVIKKIIF
ncbi:MAG: T9SS sorting signal type C domain-containing protein [Flavobacterium sp.]|uniref:T9SS sorting signal type C domain-containing protein n=1 Tax=Flavobacterium sp. TaxID=239 RepID=UPI0032645839